MTASFWHWVGAVAFALIPLSIIAWQVWKAVRSQKQFLNKLDTEHQRLNKVFEEAAQIGRRVAEQRESLALGGSGLTAEEAGQVSFEMAARTGLEAGTVLPSPQHYAIGDVFTLNGKTYTCVSIDGERQLIHLSPVAQEPKPQHIDNNPTKRRIIKQ